MPYMCCTGRDFLAFVFYLCGQRKVVAVIEVLSPEDRVSRYQQRLDDYRAMGVANVWVIDPMRARLLTAARAAGSRLMSYGSQILQLRFPSIRIWKKLNELRS